MLALCLAATQADNHFSDGELVATLGTLFFGFTAFFLSWSPWASRREFEGLLRFLLPANSKAAGTLQDGALSRYRYRIVLRQGESWTSATDRIRAAFPDARFTVDIPAAAIVAARFWFGALFLTGPEGEDFVPDHLVGRVPKDALGSRVERGDGSTVVDANDAVYDMVHDGTHPLVGLGQFGRLIAGRVHGWLSPQTGSAQFSTLTALGK